MDSPLAFFIAMSKAKAAQDKRDAILLSSIEYYAKKQDLRPLLEEGTATHVEATIDGKVGRGKVSLEIFGTLNVGQPTGCNSSSSAPTVDVVAELLASIPFELRDKVSQRLIGLFEAGNLGAVDDDVKKQAKALLAKLKKTTPSTRAGAVSFSME